MGETLRRTLEYLGIAEDEEAIVTDDPRAMFEALERRVAAQAEQIAALRAEVEELRARC
jgi:hypothetical protein